MGDGSVPGLVGMVGLGVMGSRMARNLLRAGHMLVVYDKIPSAVEEAVGAGAAAAKTPEEVARKCRTVLLSLPTTEVVREVVLGKEGLVGGLSHGGVVIDTSTVDPEVAVELSEELSAKGCYFLDAPVSGGPEGADKATLSIMVGGDASAFERSVSLLEKVGKHVFHVGPSGSGQKMKLFNQGLVSVYFGVVSELYPWSRRAGIDGDAILEVIQSSWGDSPVFRHFMSVVRSGEFSDGAMVRLFKKDVTLLLKNAEDNGSRIPLVRLSLRLFERASESGHDNDDASVLCKQYE